MMLYLLLSAYPQEIISKVFFFQCYAHLFPNIKLLILMKALIICLDAHFVCQLDSNYFVIYQRTVFCANLLQNPLGIIGDN